MQLIAGLPVFYCRSLHLLSVMSGFAGLGRAGG